MSLRVLCVFEKINFLSSVITDLQIVSLLNLQKKCGNVFFHTINSYLHSVTLMTNVALFFSKAINMISNKKQQVNYLLWVDGSSHRSNVHIEAEHL